MSAVAYIGLGANLGPRRRTIDRALRELDARPGIRLLKRSPLVETAPEGPVRDQPAFLNGAAALRTTLEPGELLAALREVEARLGRRRRARGGPREIDLDLLFYGARVLRSRGLAVPHPRLARRLFVLEPLAALAPRKVHPVLRRTVARLLAEERARRAR